MASNCPPEKRLVGLRWPIVLVILVAFALRVLWLGRGELWFDEAASAFIAAKSLSGIISYIQGQFFEHPPIYYILLHGWIQLTGASEFSLRYFSALFGVLLVALLCPLIRAFASRSTVLCALFITAILPFQIVQSYEARMYTLVSCLGVLSTLSLYRAITAGRSQWWIAYGAVTVVGMGTHYYFILLLLAQGAYVLLCCHSSRVIIGKWVLTMASLSVPSLIWLLLSSGPRVAIVQSFQNWSLSQANFADIERLGIETVFGISATEGFSIVDRLGALAVLAVGALGMVLGKKSLETHRAAPPATIGHSLHVLLGFSVVIPVLGGLIMPHNIVARYIAFSSPALYVLLGMGATFGGRLRLLSASGLCAIAVVSVYGITSFFASSNEGGFAATAAILKEASQPGDEVVLTHPHQWPIVEYYLSGGPPVNYVPGDAKPPSEQDVDAAMQATTAGRRRIWLGPISAWTMDPQSKVESWLLQNSYRASKQWLPGSASISLFYLSSSKLELRSAPYRLDPYVQLRGYAMSQQALAPADAALVRLSWQPIANSPFQLLLGLRLVDRASRVWSDSTEVLEANGTEPKETLYALVIPPGTPSGKYRVELSAYSPAQGTNLLFTGSATTGATGALLTIGEVDVVSAGRPIPIAVDRPTIKGVFGEEIELLSAEAKADKYKQGDRIGLILAWHALKTSQSDYVALLRIVDSRGRQVSEVQAPLVAEGYPPTRWKAGEYLKGLYEVPIPSDLPGGQYALQVALRNPSTGALLAMQGERWGESLWGLWERREPLQGVSLNLLSFSVVERDRNFKVPSISSPRDDNFGGKVKLAGHGDLTPTIRSGDSLRLTLYWQAISTMDTSYTVFVHLLNDKGEVVAQQDSVPRGGAYPTTLWVGGEFVADEHLVPLRGTLPPGQYTIAIGLYDLKTMARLPVIGPAGERNDDKVVLPLTIMAQ